MGRDVNVPAWASAAHLQAEVRWSRIVYVCVCEWLSPALKEQSK